ncbi:MAG: hypothetical protein R6U98_13050, partial [Pirellulaceae bacterium]
QGDGRRGRMLASTVFEDEEVLTYETRVNVVQLPASGLEGTTLAEEEVRTTTGCTVIAVSRNGDRPLAWRVRKTGDTWGLALKVT